MKNVLIVDDEIIIGMHTQNILKKYNYDAATVTSGEKALASMNEGTVPDLILMDIDLGTNRIDGVETTRRICEKYDIPVVFHSGHTDRETIDKTKAVTKYGYVHKVPGNEMYLSSSVEMALSLHETNRKLMESEGKTRFQAQLLENVMEAVVATDLDGYISYWGRGAENIFGLKAEEALGKTVAVVFSNNFEQVHAERMKDVLERGFWKGEDEHKKDDGSKFWTETKIFLVKDETGNPVGLVSVGEDITERKNAEEVTAALSKFPGENPNPVLRISKDGTIMYSNEASQWLLDAWGCEGGQSLPDKWWRTVQNTFDKRIPQEIEFECSAKIFSLTFAPVMESNYINICGLDITERKQAEEKLKTNQFYLEKAQEIGSIGTWELDMQENKLIWTDENYRFFSRPPRSEQTYETFLECVHPDDREYVDRKWKAAMGGEPYDIEHRLIADGKVKWVREKAELEFDKGGNCVRSIGFTQDVTVKKKMEKKYKNILQTSMDGFWIVDIEGNFLDVNDSYCGLIGYSRDELLAMGIADIEAIEADTEVKNHMKRIMTTGSERFETVHKTKSGMEINVEVSTNYLEEDRELFVFVRDITERKQAEDALRESENRFRSIVESTDAGYFYIDRKGIIQEVNDAWMKLYRFSSPDEIIGKHFTAVQQVENIERAKEFVSGIMHGEEEYYKGEFSRKCKDGTIGYHSFSARPVVKDNEVHGIEGFIIDTTERHRMEEQLKRSLRENKILLRETHHRVKNNLAMISSLIHLHSRDEKNEESRNRLKELDNQIKSIGMVHDKFNFSKEVSIINFKEYVKDIVDSIFSGYGNKDVKIEVDMQDMSIAASISIPLGLIVNELTTNAIKYGFKTDGPHEFSIQMKEDTKKENYILKVKNSGSHFPDDVDFKTTKSLGMRLISFFTQHLGGTIELNTNEGTEFIITFPLVYVNSR